MSGEWIKISTEHESDGYFGCDIYVTEYYSKYNRNERMRVWSDGRRDFYRVE